MARSDLAARRRIRGILVLRRMLDCDAGSAAASAMLFGFERVEPQFEDHKAIEPVVQVADRDGRFRSLMHSGIGILKRITT